MSYLSWNCRGLGNPDAVRYCEARRTHSSLRHGNKNKGKRVEDLQRHLGFGGCFAVDSVGLSGGIGLFWSHDVLVDLKNYSASHIDVSVKFKEQNSFQWRFTGFYAKAKRSERSASWELLRWLRTQSDLPWLCGGDMNEILQGSEYWGTW